MRCTYLGVITGNSLGWSEVALTKGETALFKPQYKKLFSRLSNNAIGFLQRHIIKIISAINRTIPDTNNCIKTQLDAGDDDTLYWEIFKEYNYRDLLIFMDASALAIMCVYKLIKVLISLVNLAFTAINCKNCEIRL